MPLRSLQLRQIITQVKSLTINKISNDSLPKSHAFSNCGKFQGPSTTAQPPVKKSVHPPVKKSGKALQPSMPGKRSRFYLGRKHVATSHDRDMISGRCDCRVKWCCNGTALKWRKYKKIIRCPLLLPVISNALQNIHNIKQKK